MSYILDRCLSVGFVPRVYLSQSRTLRRSHSCVKILSWPFYAAIQAQRHTDARILQRVDTSARKHMVFITSAYLKAVMVKINAKEMITWTSKYLNNQNYYILLLGNHFRTRWYYLLDNGKSVVSSNSTNLSNTSFKNFIHSFLLRSLILQIKEFH